MKARGCGKRAGKADDTGVGRPRRKKPPEPAERTIPVCLGEFGIDEARRFGPLWEATWSQDARGKAGKK